MFCAAPICTHVTLPAPKLTELLRVDGQRLPPRDILPVEPRALSPHAETSGAGMDDAVVSAVRTGCTRVGIVGGVVPGILGGVHTRVVPLLTPVGHLSDTIKTPVGTPLSDTIKTPVGTPLSDTVVHLSVHLSDTVVHLSVLRT